MLRLAIVRGRTVRLSEPSLSREGLTMPNDDEVCWSGR
jgi:hypothetical protein